MSLKTKDGQIATTVALFSIRDESLCILMEKPGRSAPTGWRLPVVENPPNQDLDTCAQLSARQLGFTKVYLEQLYTFSPQQVSSSPRSALVAYLGIVPKEKGARAPARGRWFSVDAVPRSQHTPVVLMARDRLVAKAEYSTIVFNFLTQPFTLGELQSAHEAVLGEGVDKRNFRKRMLSTDLLRDTGRLKTLVSHRPAKLYEYCGADNIQYLK